MGDNGVGKTNILESIYLLCTGKSHKKSKRIEMINFNNDYFFIEGDFSFKNIPVFKVGLGFGYDKRPSYLLDNKKIDTFLDWFGCRPVLSISSDDINLIYGSPENRRKYRRWARTWRA